MKAILLGGLALLVAASTVAAAEDYPTRPVTMIVPFAAGGTSDVIARVTAEQMSQALGQRVLNENVAGAGGTTALGRVARASADGYTIAIGNVGTNAAAYTIYPDIKYTNDDFVPIGLIAKTIPVIAVRKDFPAADLKGFIAYARQNPGKVNLGHAGIGSSNYLICKTFMAAAEIDVTLVSYRGAAPALNDLMGGQVDGVCDAAASVSGAIQNGMVRGLLVSASARLPSLPQVPTATEAGLPEFQQQGWNALFAPKGTLPAVIDRLNAALRRAVASEALLRRMDDLGSVAATGEEFEPAYVGRLVNEEIAKYRKVLAAP